MLTKISNAYSALVNCSSTFIDAIKELDSYFGTFDLEYGVKLVDDGNKCIFNDTFLSEYIWRSTQVPYVRYTQLAQVCINESVLLPRLSWLSIESKKG